MIYDKVYDDYYYKEHGHKFYEREPNSVYDEKNNHYTVKQYNNWLKSMNQ